MPISSHYYKQTTHTTTTITYMTTTNTKRQQRKHIFQMQCWLVITTLSKNINDECDNAGNDSDPARNIIAGVAKDNRDNINNHTAAETEHRKESFATWVCCIDSRISSVTNIFCGVFECLHCVNMFYTSIVQMIQQQQEKIEWKTSMRRKRMI